MRCPDPKPPSPASPTPPPQCSPSHCPYTTPSSVSPVALYPLQPIVDTGIGITVPKPPSLGRPPAGGHHQGCPPPHGFWGGSGHHRRSPPPPPFPSRPPPDVSFAVGGPKIAAAPLRVGAPGTAASAHGLRAAAGRGGLWGRGGCGDSRRDRIGLGTPGAPLPCSDRPLPAPRDVFGMGVVGPGWGDLRFVVGVGRGGMVPRGAHGVWGRGGKLGDVGNWGDQVRPGGGGISMGFRGPMGAWGEPMGFEGTYGDLGGPCGVWGNLWGLGNLWGPGEGSVGFGGPMGTWGDSGGPRGGGGTRGCRGRGYRGAERCPRPGRFLPPL